MQVSRQSVFDDRMISVFINTIMCFGGRCSGNKGEEGRSRAREDRLSVVRMKVGIPSNTVGRRDGDETGSLMTRASQDDTC